MSGFKPPLSNAEQDAKATGLAQAHIGFIALCEQLKKLDVITHEEFADIKATREKMIRKSIGLHDEHLKLVQ